jgi:hypothetical protein
MPLENLNCPRCGAILQVTAFTSLLTCDYCKSTIRLSPNQPNEQSSKKNNFQIVLPIPEESPWYKDISDALTRLLKSDKSSSFVIFYKRKIEKCVQFGYPLILDLPFNLLNAGEIERATAFFLNLGVSKPEVEDLYSTLSLERVVSKRTFYKYDFGQDVKLATQITLAIFQQVYQYPINFDLDYDEE